MVTTPANYAHKPPHQAGPTRYDIDRIVAIAPYA